MPTIQGEISLAILQILDDAPPRKWLTPLEIRKLMGGRLEKKKSIHPLLHHLSERLLVVRRKNPITDRFEYRRAPKKRPARAAAPAGRNSADAG